MRYLLDVNALVALGLFQHEFHVRVTSWVTKITADDSAELATCAITELGFVRILAQATQYGFAISHARSLLFSLKKAGIARFTFITDDQDVSRLPAWVKTPRRTTDGHLAQLAKANGAVLATLDARIPGAFLVPNAA